MFRPQSGPLDATIFGPIELIEGDIFNEWRVQLDITWGSFTVRQYSGQSDYEVEWLVGPIDSK